MRSMTQAKLTWVQSTIRQMELAGFEPTEILTKAFERYVNNQISFYDLCAVIRDEAD